MLKFLKKLQFLKKIASENQHGFTGRQIFFVQKVAFDYQKIKYKFKKNRSIRFEINFWLVGGLQRPISNNAINCKQVWHRSARSLGQYLSNGVQLVFQARSSIWFFFIWKNADFSTRFWGLSQISALEPTYLLRFFLNHTIFSKTVKSILISMFCFNFGQLFVKFCFDEFNT